MILSSILGFLAVWDGTDHIDMKPSAETVTSASSMPAALVGAAHMAVTGPRCPLRKAADPVSTLHSLTMPSSCPVTSTFCGAEGEGGDEGEDGQGRKREARGGEFLTPGRFRH